MVSSHNISKRDNNKITIFPNCRFSYLTTIGEHGNILRVFRTKYFDVNKMTFHYFEHFYKAARKRAAVFSTLRIERGKKARISSSL